MVIADLSPNASSAPKKISLMDCFAAALAKKRKIDLGTGNPEFRSIDGEVRIIWL